MIKNNLDALLEKRFFPRVQRPGRYVGGELYAVKPQEGDFQIALAFPDLYEIGFPYLGFQILYHLLNEIEGVSCQRVYAPADDAERILREEKIPLFTLEGRVPLRKLDLLGFTLQYELHSSNILNILELGKIALHSAERNKADPIVLGGGPLAFNPEPFADFFDAFFIGDGEEVLPALVEKIRDWKVSGAKRGEIITRMSQFAGVYVPSFYRPLYDSSKRFIRLNKTVETAPESIRAVTTETLKLRYYPEKPLVPLIAVEHDRLTVEIMRGCSRGCRFCHAGMINRPTREVDPQDVIRQIERALANTGYEEISLLSLSTADYSYIGELLMGINELLQGTSISLSYPSLRPDAFTREMAESIIGGRKTSLTFAPEAGSERLRASINKDLKDEDLFQALQIAKDEGWRSAKLYFMVGLPGESDTDVEALVKLARKSRDILCSSPKKPLHISVSVFSPKPHTGFQRAELIESEDIIRRIRMIKRGLGSPNFKISIHQHEMSKVETLLARGDRRLGKVIERVFKSGARFEGWSDRFDYNRWDVAMEEEGLDWKWFIGAKSEDENLSWSHISTGIKEEFLVQEWRRAQDGVLTPDCRDKCSRCGKECPPPPRSKLRSSILTKRDALKAVEPKLKVRFKFTRTGPACFCSQLETAKIIERTLRRAKLPVAFSLGFHPHPKMSFGPALPLGYESKGEYFDVGLLKMDEEDVVRLREAVYGGIEIQSGRMIDWSVPSLGNSVNYLKHYVQLHLIKPGLLELIEDLKNGKPLLTMNRKGEVWEISKFIRRMELYGKELQYEVEILVGKYPRLETILIKAGYEKYEMGLISRECFRFTDGKIKEL